MASALKKFYAKKDLDVRLRRFSQSKMSDETFDFVCTTCEQENKTLEAVKYCVECVGYCCQGCTDIHKKFPTLKNHNLLGVDHGSQAGKLSPSLPEYPTERCSTHPGKVLDMYCEKDDIVGCTTCISKDHRLCPDSQIHSIPDMIQNLFNLSASKNAQSQLQALLVSTTTFGKSIDVQLEELIRHRDDMLQKVTQCQRDLQAAVNKAAEISRSEVMRVYKKLEQEILVEKFEYQKTKNALQEINDKLNKAKKNRAQRFMLTKLAERKITQTEKEIRELKERIKTNEQISFTPNHTIMDNINGLQGIGVVSSTSKKRSDMYGKVERKVVQTKVSSDTNYCWTGHNNL